MRHIALIYNHVATTIRSLLLLMNMLLLLTEFALATSGLTVVQMWIVGYALTLLFLCYKYRIDYRHDTCSSEIAILSISLACFLVSCHVAPVVALLRRPLIIMPLVLPWLDTSLWNDFLSIRFILLLPLVDLLRWRYVRKNKLQFVRRRTLATTLLGRYFTYIAVVWIHVLIPILHLDCIVRPSLLFTWVIH